VVGRGPFFVDQGDSVRKTGRACMVNVICSPPCFWGARVGMARLLAVGWR